MFYIRQTSLLEVGSRNGNSVQASYWTIRYGFAPKLSKSWGRKQKGLMYQLQYLNKFLGKALFY